jgi:hypothetical protein
VDQAAANAAFLQFREQLLQAIGRKDAAFVESILAPDVRNEIEGETGVAAFRSKWHPDQAASKLWTVLGDILRLGGSFEPDGSFAAPYTFSRFPDDLDSIETLVIIGSGVALRSAPRLDAPLLARLSYELVTADDPSRPITGWVRVRTETGQVGYVAEHLVRSPIDYRAGFAKRDGTWRLIYLVAGD